MNNVSKLKSALKNRYKDGYEDYWMKPLIHSKNGHVIGRINSNDGVIFNCRRGEREVQLTEAFTDNNFEYFKQSKLENIKFVPLTHYHKKFKSFKPIFTSGKPDKTFVDQLSKNGIKQIRITESEKKPHITYFLNGKKNTLPNNTAVKIVPSRKKDREENPGEETRKITDIILQSMQKDKYGCILINYSAGDIIGHINNWEANIKCAEEIDIGLGRILEKGLKNTYTILITADHGLLEKFKNDDGTFNSSHTTAKVPFILIDKSVIGKKEILKNKGTLADVAPTALEILDISVPEEMKGKSLLKKKIPTTDKLILIILDGWGIGENDKTVNPIIAANTPNFDYIMKTYPSSKLVPFGHAVGLPDKRKGNSEAGHLTITSGKAIKQDELIIEEAIRNGKLKNNTVLNNLFSYVTNKDSNLHLIAMLSELSSHGNFKEAFEISRIASEWEIDNMYLHLILDGRSSPQQGAVDLLDKYKKNIYSIKNMEVVTAIGRGYVLDRSGDYYGKTKIAYDALVLGKGDTF